MLKISIKVNLGEIALPSSGLIIAVERERDPDSLYHLEFRLKIIKLKYLNW